MRKIKAAFIAQGLAFSFALTLATTCFAEDAPSVGNLFIEAYTAKDKAKMEELIKTRTKEFPPEVQAMVEYALSPGVSPEEQDFLFNIAGNIAAMYGKHTGDDRLLKAVRANYSNVLNKRKSSALTPALVKAIKKELTTIGEGRWRVRIIKLDENGALIVDIDVKEPEGGGEGFTPHIDFKKSQKAKEMIKAKLPKVTKGKISWTSMGVGLKTAFLDQ